MFHPIKHQPSTALAAGDRVDLGGRKYRLDWFDVTKGSWLTKEDETGRTIEIQSRDLEENGFVER